jgi:hypothetical protein
VLCFRDSIANTKLSFVVAEKQTFLPPAVASTMFQKQNLTSPPISASPVMYCDIPSIRVINRDARAFIGIHKLPASRLLATPNYIHHDHPHTHACLVQSLQLDPSFTASTRKVPPLLPPGLLCLIITRPATERRKPTIRPRNDSHGYKHACQLRLKSRKP